MSRVLLPPELPRQGIRRFCHRPRPTLGAVCRPASNRAPKRNRTVDLLLTMETLDRLSYRSIRATCSPPGDASRKIHGHWLRSEIRVHLAAAASTLVSTTLSARCSPDHPD